jgi:hypothetical protein
MGPKFGPSGTITIRVTFRGQRPGGDYQTALLGPDSPTGLHEKYGAKPIPGLRELLAREPDSGTWDYCGYTERQRESARDQLTFWRVASQRTLEFPRRIRLALYFPDDNSLYLTDPVQTSRRDNNTFEAVIEADGTATLQPLTEISWVEEYYVLKMLAALIGTLVIELAVALIWVGATKRRASARRVVLVALAGNLVTVPAVWTTSLMGKTHFDFQTAVVIYSVAEVGAFLVEGGLYAWLGRFPAWNAFLLSFTANCASFLCGCCLVSFY